MTERAVTRARLAAMVPGGLPAGPVDISARGPLSLVQQAALLRAARHLDPHKAVEALEALTTLDDLLDVVDPVATPSGGGGSIGLRPVVPTDHALLYRWWLDPVTNPRWVLRGRTPSFEEWLAGLHRGALAQFIVCATATGEALGHVVAYDHVPEAGHCKIGVCGLPSSPSRPRAAASAGLLQLVDYAFSTFGLRKVYFEVPEYNRHLLAGLEQFVTVEADFVDHLVFEGSLVGMQVVAVSRSQWTDWRGAWGGGAGV